VKSQISSNFQMPSKCCFGSETLILLGQKHEHNPNVKNERPVRSDSSPNRRRLRRRKNAYKWRKANSIPDNSLNRSITISSISEFFGARTKLRRVQRYRNDKLVQRHRAGVPTKSVRQPPRARPEKNVLSNFSRSLPGNFPGNDREKLKDL
jgi:hypothetical protein